MSSNNEATEKTNKVTEETQNKPQNEALSNEVPNEKPETEEDEEQSNENPDNEDGDEEIGSTEPKEDSVSVTENNENVETVEDEESPIYKNKLPNRVIVTANGRRSSRRAPRLQFYVDRARRILRSDETVTVSGLGQAISMACTLVEVLKRQKIAKIVSVKTTVDVDPTFAGPRLIWGRPTPAIRFVLSRGPHAKYVSDYHQRKVIEIFENKDTKKTGKLSKSIVADLKIGETFAASEEQEQEASEFINKINGDSINLPDFIKYASLLIHPLLKDRKFKERLAKYGIEAQDNETSTVAEVEEHDESSHE